MKKKLKKICLFFLFLCICFCFCFLKFNKLVYASSANEYQEINNWFENSTFLPNEFSDINDLKGKTFTVDPNNLLYMSQLDELDIYINILERDYIGIEFNEETHETIQCIDYLLYPYVIYERYDIDLGHQFSLFSLYLESSSNYSCVYINDIALNSLADIQLTGSVVSFYNNFAYLPIENIVERRDVPLNLNSITGINNNTYYINYSNYKFLTESEFLNEISSYNMTSQYLNFYFVFPNTDRYSLGLNPSYYLPLFENLTYIQPYNANITDKINYGIQQYDFGYNKGLIDGQLNALDDTYRFPFLTGILNIVSDILSIQIFPNINLGYFILLPLTLGVVGMIFYFWRKD